MSIKGTSRRSPSIFFIIVGLFIYALAIAALDDTIARAALIVLAICVTLILLPIHRREQEPVGKSDALEDVWGFAWTSDSQGHITGASSALLEYLGQSATKKWPDLGSATHPEDVRGAAKLWRRSLENGQDYQATYRIRNRDGAYRWFRAVAHSKRDPDGTIIGWRGMLVDIDDLKQVENALRVSEKGLQSILDSIPGLVSTADAAGAHNYSNKTRRDFHGVDSSELDGTRFLETIHPDDREMLVAERMNCMQNGVAMDMAHRMRRHDGVYRWFHARVEPIFDERGGVAQWYGLFTDIDDQIKAQEALRVAQEQLSQSSQFASLAQLSASIAHEINQPLAAVVTNSHSCRRWLSADPPNLERARTAADRIVRDSIAAADVVRNTRALFARKAATRGWVDLNEVIGEVGRMIRDERVSWNVPVSTDLEPELPAVFADRLQMTQIIYNLVRNGIEASKTNVDTPKTLEVRSRRDGDNVQIDVRDNGPGISEPDRIFDPFFTTKEEGMGMGLSICRSILEAHDGRIWAESLKPRGAMFSFALPVQPAEAS